MAENPDVVFVKEYIKTNDALLAFNRAGYHTGGVGAKVMAERTLARPEIKIALGVLADFGIERASDIPVNPLSRDGLVDKLDVIHEAAMAEASFPSAINAVKTQAQLLGFMEQKVTVSHSVRASELSLEDLRAMVSKELSATPALIEAEYTEVNNDT